MIYKLGIDFGNVIMTANPPSMWKTDHMNCPPNEGAFENIRELVDNFGDENAFIVSRVFTEQSKSKTLEWLATHCFPQTGLLLRNVHFCFERKEKGNIVKDLAITNFVDDRPEVMFYLPDSCNRRYLYKPLHSDLSKWEHKAEVHEDWFGLKESILLTLK